MLVGPYLYVKVRQKKKNDKAKTITTSTRNKITQSSCFMSPYLSSVEVSRARLTKPETSLRGNNNNNNNYYYYY